jgi:hypothetical protein
MLGRVDWEVVLRRAGQPDEVISLSADNLRVGEAFPRGSTNWVVAEDDGPSNWPDHAARLICEPIDDD